MNNDIIELFVRNTSKNPTPTYATPFASGFDIAAAETVTIPAKDFNYVKTGLFVEIAAFCVDEKDGQYTVSSKQYEIQIRSRSGLALKRGLRVFQGIGTIDQDYRGELIVLLENTNPYDVVVDGGTRIAQGIVAEVKQATIKESQNLSETDRGEGGFGSTGEK